MFKVGIVLAVIGAITFAASFKKDVVECKELVLKTPVKWMQLAVLILGIVLMVIYR